MCCFLEVSRVTQLSTIFFHLVCKEYLCVTCWNKISLVTRHSANCILLSLQKVSACCLLERNFPGDPAFFNTLFMTFAVNCSLINMRVLSFYRQIRKPKEMLCVAFWKFVEWPSFQLYFFIWFAKNICVSLVETKFR